MYPRNPRHDDRVLLAAYFYERDIGRVSHIDSRTLALRSLQKAHRCLKHILEVEEEFLQDVPLER